MNSLEVFYRIITREASPWSQLAYAREREDIDRTEAQLFRQINGLPNIISNKAIMNVACSMRNAWEIVEPLALRANL